MSSSPGRKRPSSFRNGCALKRGAFLLGLCLYLCLLAGLRLPAADLSGTYAWKPMKIGGGGWLVGMNISPTEKDLVYVRTDVSGAYRWNAATATWKQLVTDRSLPPEYVAYGKYDGVDSIVSSPKEPDVAYMAFRGQIFKSANRGDTWTATTFAGHGVPMEANGEGRQEGERLGVDPNDGDVVYYCPISGVPWVTGDGGATWSQVAGVPAGKPPHGVNTVVFDQGGGTTGPRTRVIYLTVDQAGVFRSADAGATWSNIAQGGPGAGAKPRSAKLGPDRTYYVACDNEQGAAGSVWKYGPEGKWADITPPPPNGGSQPYWDIAVDPTDGRRLVAMENGGKCFVSADQGATWTYHLFHLNSTGISWLGRQENYFLSVGELAFDPFDPGKLWFAEGFGAWWTKDLTTPAIEWHAASEGIEEACANEVISPPGGKPVAAMWDIGVFYFPDPDAYAAQRALPNFMAAWALDWCPADPKFIAAIFRNNLNFGAHPKMSGYSTDGGRTWARFPAVENGTLPADLEYGAIAVSAQSPGHLVWCPAFTKLPYYTDDRGATWKRCDCGGLAATGLGPYHSGQKPICADRVLPDTFYLYTTNDGVYRSTDGGAHFAKAGGPACPGRNNAILKATPGRAGDLWFAEQAGGGLWHSADGGATWAAIPGFGQCFNVGLGKARDAGGYPAVYADGVLDGATGIYRSTDAGATWDKICGYPLGLFEWVDALDGDKDVFGKVYLGFAQAGFAYGQPQEAGSAPPAR